MGHSSSGVGVLDKAVVILGACVDGASLAELVERTKLPRATAHRLAQALEIHRMLVRDSAGEVVRDPSGRAPGRGAYLHSDATCVDQAKRRRALERALKGPVSATLWGDLTAHNT